MGCGCRKARIPKAPTAAKGDLPTRAERQEQLRQARERALIASGAKPEGK